MADIFQGKDKSTLTNAALLASLKPSDRKFEFRVTKKEPKTVLQIREAAAILECDMSDFAREAVEEAYNRVKAGQPTLLFKTKSR